MIYGVLPEEYVCYNYRNLNDRGKREYITDFSREAVYKKCNNRNFTHIFENKYETYCTFKPFYQRDAILLNNKTAKQELNNFITKHKRFICKPLLSALGRGVTIFDVKDFIDLESLTLHLLSLTTKNTEFILEELIKQTPDLSVFHPRSVNTIRVPAFSTNDGVVINGVFFRCGKGDSIVDNGGAGGILVAVDERTGVLTTKGMDEMGNVYLRHPDSGVLFPGYQLPDWNQLVEMVSELMKIVPEVKYTGWDLAHTENGWIVVEGNFRGQFVGQIPLQKGLNKQIKAILERM